MLVRLFLLQPTEQATMADLDSYLEFLYDDLQAKISGTALILHLARTPDNLIELAGNGMMRFTVINFAVTIYSVK